MKSGPFYIPKEVLILTGLAVLLNIARVAFSGSIYFLYLLWNLFLAFLPFCISLFLMWYSIHAKKPHLAVLFLGGLLWLILFPNAPYIVTDVMHLKESHAVPVWYDALLLFTSAWTGMLLGLYSLAHIEKTLETLYSKKLTWVLLTLCIFLASFGVYIGRFLRLNSWDIFANPQDLSSGIWGVFSNPQVHAQGFWVTASFFVFILLSYLAWKSGKHTLE